MAMARVAMATAVKPGDLARVRKAKRRSCIAEVVSSGKRVVRRDGG
jgi:hypothetical protein